MGLATGKIKPFDFHQQLHFLVVVKNVDYYANFDNHKTANNGDASKPTFNELTKKKFIGKTLIHTTDSYEQQRTLLFPVKNPNPYC